MRFAQVAVDAPWTLHRTFSYSIPSGLSPEPGHIVWVPFGPRILQGIVFDISSQPLVEETRDVHSLVDPHPLLKPYQLELARWIAQNYRASLFDATALMLPPGIRRRILSYFSLRPGGSIQESSLSTPQRDVISYLRLHGEAESKALKQALGARAVTAAEQLWQRKMLRKDWRLARPSVGPKYKSMVTLQIAETEVTHWAGELRGSRAYQQAKLIEQLYKEGEPLEPSQLRSMGISNAVVKAAQIKGLVSVERTRMQRDPLRERRFYSVPAPALTGSQQRVWEIISRGLDNDSHGSASSHREKIFLLHGVTGSGKTEIYLRAVDRMVSQGKRCIVMVPEISLTPQTIDRFGTRFLDRVAVLHSRLSPGEQFDEWWRINGGEFYVVVGSRSALFVPQAPLGLIVIDEEHDPSYKQTDPSPRYHAREVALKLAELTGAAVILGSATPDVVTYYNAGLGQTRLVQLPRRIVPDHHGGIKEEDQLPKVDVVDMRAELRADNRSIFSRALMNAMTVALGANHQVILFLNRRGSATFIQCRECGHSLRCRRCEVALTYHAAPDRLVCHHCNARSRRPSVCPECRSARMSYLGIGTQRVEEEVLKAFPTAKTLRWDRDVTRGKNEHEKILQKFQAHEADVLIGTQMIAKGLHIPKVTLVGVVSADIGINLPDFRAGERAFQVLSQVAGRAGRGPLGGKVIVQTFNPHHYAVAHAARQDYEAFYQREIEYRKRHSYPPFGRMTRLVFSHTNASYAQREAARLATLLRKEQDRKGVPNTDIIGPVPCFVPRLRGRYRWQIMLRNAQPSQFLESIPIPDKWVVDIDPLVLL